VAINFHQIGIQRFNIRSTAGGLTGWIDEGFTLATGDDGLERTAMERDAP